MSDERSDEEVGFQIGYERASYGVCRQDLDAMGERAVRDALNSDKYGHAGLAPFAFVSAWLADAAFMRDRESEAKRDEREERTLSIAEESNRIARSASRWAMWAAIIATIAALIATKDQIVALVISWLA
jgi:hypothetical protein